MSVFTDIPSITEHANQARNISCTCVGKRLVGESDYYLPCLIALALDQFYDTREESILTPGI